MINPLDELSDIYLGQISEADNSPEAIKARVMQHVRAIRYRARKEGDQLNKAYNDYMAGQAGISATEKSMVKERLGLTGGAQHQEGMAYGLSKGSGKPSGPMAAFGKKNKLNKTDDKKKKVQSFKKFKAGQEPASASAPDMSEATLATARKNIGRDPKKKSCWKGYKATGTKMKDGRAVPDCKPV